MKFKKSHSMDIAKVAVSLSFFNVILALTSHNSVVLAKIRFDTADAARSVVKEAVKDIETLKNIKVRQ